MFRNGELNKQEEEVISRLQLSHFARYKLTYYKDVKPRVYVAEHLNYRITEAGGDATTKGK